MIIIDVSSTINVYGGTPPAHGLQYRQYETDIQASIEI
jgi:hypothetical protein